MHWFAIRRITIHSSPVLYNFSQFFPARFLPFLWTIFSPPKPLRIYYLLPVCVPKYVLLINTLFTLSPSCALPCHPLLSRWPFFPPPLALLSPLFFSCLNHHSTAFGFATVSNSLCGMGWGPAFPRSPFQVYILLYVANAPLMPIRREPSIRYLPCNSPFCTQRYPSPNFSITPLPSECWGILFP